MRTGQSLPGWALLRCRCDSALDSAEVSRTFRFQIRLIDRHS